MVIGEYGRRWLVLATVASLGGCANPTSWVPAVSSNQGTASQPVMFVGPCVFPSGGPEAGFLAAAGGILAKEAIGAAVKSLGELIKEAGEEQHWKLEGTRLMTFAGRQPRHCIQFVVGRFFEDPALAQTTIAGAHWQLPYVSNEELKNLAVASIWLADRPEVLIEFESVSGPEALGYQLTYISYDRPFRPVTPGYNPQAALAVRRWPVAASVLGARRRASAPCRRVRHPHLLALLHQAQGGVSSNCRAQERRPGLL